MKFSQIYRMWQKFKALENEILGLSPTTNGDFLCMDEFTWGELRKAEEKFKIINKTVHDYFKRYVLQYNFKYGEIIKTSVNFYIKKDNLWIKVVYYVNDEGYRIDSMEENDGEDIYYPLAQ